jgi:hypothetical protein
MRSTLLATAALFAVLAFSTSAAFARGYPPIETSRDEITAPEPYSTGYHYDPNTTNGAYARPKIKETKPEEPITLGTPTSFEAGVQFSRYEYEEPNVEDNIDVYIRGLKYGIDGRFTYNIQDWFFQLEGRYAGGDDDYQGSGKIEGVADNLAEGRLLAGRDFLVNEFGLSPYVGVGFRDLFNDSRGVSTTGALGYKRESQYLYMPIGVTGRTRIDRDSRVSLNVEYDQFLWGRQYSDLNDVSEFYPELVNSQTWGYGLRGELMYERRSWGLGPFFDYWNINQSEDSCATRFTTTDRFIYRVTACGYEPHNDTLEYGIRFRYRFF